MSQSMGLIDALKAALRRRGVTYADVARRLGLSESSVKRVFARKSLSLARFERICELIGLEIGDLVELAQHEEERLTELTEEQERQIVGDPKVLLVAVLAINHWTFERILQTYRLTEAELVRTLARLDRMGIVDLMPNNRIKVRLARNFNWRKAGPIQRHFEQRLQQEFFKSSFLAADELRLIVNGSLSRQSIERLQGQMRRVAEDFDALAGEDRRLAPETQNGTSLLMAMRPWEPTSFAVLRRDAPRPVPRRPSRASARK